MKLRSGESGGRLPLSWDFDFTVLLRRTGECEIGVGCLFMVSPLRALSLHNLSLVFFSLIGEALNSLLALILSLKHSYSLSNSLQLLLLKKKNECSFFS